MRYVACVVVQVLHVLYGCIMKALLYIHVTDIIIETQTRTLLLFLTLLRSDIQILNTSHDASE